MRPDDAREATLVGEAALPEPVRDHLGQQLRSVFTTEAAVPQYLGDPVVPEAFGPQLERLEIRLKTHEEGTEAVEQALETLLGDLAASAPDAP